MKPILSMFMSVTLLLAVAAAAQGPLTPPGPPAPTMKTLDQIEPRTDVAKLSGGPDSHVLITNAGSYYLSTNLAVTNTIGITIAAAGVTLDLKGFEIARVSGSGGDGIRINAGKDRATVRNGTLRGFSYGINGTASPFSKGCLFEKLAITGCSEFGIYAGVSARIVDCRAHDNPGSGIVGLNGSVISGCTAHTNLGVYGIFGDFGSTISDCTAQGNQGTYGIYGYNGSTISGCTAHGNQSTYGIAGGQGATIRGCTANANVGTGNSYGIFGVGGNTIIACTSNDNSNTNLFPVQTFGIGIYAVSASTVKDCTASRNRGTGILVSSECLAEGNTCHGNGTGGDGSGIFASGARNRIEANKVTSNPQGISVNASLNLIFRNSAGNNGINYSIAGNNTYGSIIDRTVLTGSPGVIGNSAVATTGTTDPWANFSH